MKLKAPQIIKALDDGAENYRLIFLYGPDESGSRALAVRMDAAIGATAERIDLDGPSLKENPARLIDEAASMSLFSDKRHIRVTGGDECAEAVSALLQNDIGGSNPVVLIAGALKATSTLVKLLLDHPQVAAFASYKAEGVSADALATSIGHQYGVRLGHGVAVRMLANCAGDRAILEREIEKVSLFLDAAPNRPREATIDTLDSVAADLDDAAIGQFVDPVLDGKLDALADMLEDFGGDSSWVPASRALLRRIVTLARLRAEVDRGKSIGTVMQSAGRAIYTKEQPSVERQLRHWSAEHLAMAHHRLFDAEFTAMDPGSSGTIILSEQLVTVARVADRRR